MIANELIKYSNYKESELSWIEKVPSHWDTKRIKDLFSQSKYKAGAKSRFYKILSLSQKGVIERDIESNKGKFPATFDGYQIVKPDSLLLCLFDMDVTPRIIGYVDQIGLVTSAYTNIIGNPKVFPKYYFYYFLNQDQNKSLLANGKGLRSSITFDNFKLLNTLVPPLVEQKAIAKYLDLKIALINQKLDLLEQKAEKYTDLKQSLINETVTRGLDTTAPMKYSGVAWIGQVPAHWDVKRISDIAVQQKNKNIGMRENNLLSLSYGKLKRKDIETSFGLLPDSFETYQIVNQGNIILRLTDLQNDWTSLRVGLARERGIITSAYLCLRFSKLINPVFAYYLLHIYDLSKIFYLFGGGLRSTMKFEDIKVLPFVFPSIEEQVTIVNYLESKTIHIEKIIETINLEIEKLKELRKTLINDVVTGKINVTGETVHE